MSMSILPRLLVMEAIFLVYSYYLYDEKFRFTSLLLQVWHNINLEDRKDTTIYVFLLSFLLLQCKCNLCICSTIWFHLLASHLTTPLSSCPFHYLSWLDFTQDHEMRRIPLCGVKKLLKKRTFYCIVCLTHTHTRVSCFMMPPSLSLRASSCFDSEISLYIENSNGFWKHGLRLWFLEASWPKITIATSGKKSTLIEAICQSLLYLAPKIKIYLNCKMEKDEKYDLMQCHVYIYKHGERVY